MKLTDRDLIELRDEMETTSNYHLARSLSEEIEKRGITVNYDSNGNYYYRKDSE